MATVVPVEVSEKLALVDGELGPNEERISDAIPPLGKPETHKRLWFQKPKHYDPKDIATQVYQLKPWSTKGYSILTADSQASTITLILHLSINLAMTGESSCLNSR